MIEGSDEHKLAHDMIDVHGWEAATVARGNARAAALAGQAIQARSWIRVLEIIQRRQAGKASAIATTAGSSTGDPEDLTMMFIAMQTARSG